jgi:quaternary ammonium compound-resistance protein SugE
MGWLALLTAGALEIFWIAGFKQLSLERPWLSGAVIAAMIASFALIMVAVRTIPVGTAYAVWTGIGAVGAAAVGIWLYQEPANALRLACIGLIVAGIVGLKLTSPA